MSKNYTTPDTFRLGYKGRLKHAELLEALARRGWNQAQAARFIGVSPSQFGEWINLGKIPSRLTKRQTARLLELTGKLPEELWPDYIRSKDFLDAPKTFEFIRNVDARKMLAAIQQRLELPATPPDELFVKGELKVKMSEVLDTLPPRIAHILRERFFEDKTLEEVARELPRPVSTERVRALEAKGLRLLRHPSRSRRLKPFIEDP